EDDLTRKFLQSTEETEEGFYPFLSKTKKYKMDFPGGGVIDNRAYFIKEKVHEEVHISIEDDTGFGMDVIYYSDDTKEHLKENLNAFKKRLGYDGEFEKIEEGNQTLNYAHYEDEVFRTYSGYVLNEKGICNIEVIYNIDYQYQLELLNKNKHSYKECALELMESLLFISENEGEDCQCSSQPLRLRMTLLEYDVLQ